MGKPCPDNQIFLVSNDGLSISVVKNYSDLDEKCVSSATRIIDICVKWGSLYIMTET